MTNKEPRKKISVIIPCYNVEELIERCLESVINQSIGLDAMEIIVVNDASTDNTLSILKEYEKEYPSNFFLINLNENVRPGGCRNIGLKYASGEYISFIDSDDWIAEDMLEKMYLKGIENDCDLVRCNFIRGKGEEHSFGLRNENDSLLDLRDENCKKDFYINHILDTMVWNKIYRRDLLELSNVEFPEKICYL